VVLKLLGVDPDRLRDGLGLDRSVPLDVPIDSLAAIGQVRVARSRHRPIVVAPET
jgi:hypothetical protein